MWLPTKIFSMIEKRIKLAVDAIRRCGYEDVVVVAPQEICEGCNGELFGLDVFVDRMIPTSIGGDIVYGTIFFMPRIIYIEAALFEIRRFAQKILGHE